MAIELTTDLTTTDPNGIRSIRLYEASQGRRTGPHAVSYVNADVLGVFAIDETNARAYADKDPTKGAAIAFPGRDLLCVRPIGTVYIDQDGGVFCDRRDCVGYTCPSIERAVEVAQALLAG